MFSPRIDRVIEDRDRLDWRHEAMVDGFVWVDVGCWRSEVLLLEIARCGSLAGYCIRFSLILQDAVALKVRYRITNKHAFLTISYLYRF